MKNTHSQLSSRAVSVCPYCGSGVLTASSEFCCVACESLYSLKDKNHSTFTSSSFSKNLEKFSYLDQEIFKNKYLTASQQMLFYVEGLHCSSCVHLLEQLPQFQDEILEARVNFGDSTLCVSQKPTGSWAQVAAMIEELGYHPIPLSPLENPEKQYQKENRDALKRLAVAGACAGNMMLFVVPVYGGLGGFWGQVFNWASFVLFLPVLFYSAKPFYQGAWNFLKYRVVNVDLPIVVAFLSGFSLSTYNLLHGEGAIYYDSTASFLFLILCSRYLLKRVQQKYLGVAFHQQTISPLAEVGQTLEIQQGQRIPVDGELLSSSAEIDLSLFNGESLPQIFQKHMQVFAGTTLLSKSAQIRVEKKDADTRLGQMLSILRTEAVKKAAFVSLTDRMAQVLIISVFSIAILYFLIQAPTDLQEALQRSLALIVIACPCALAFGTPLAYGLAIKKAREQGMIVKNSDVFEKILGIQNIFLDKTGTLTEGRLVFAGTSHASLGFEEKRIILALESQSYHPVAFALRRAWPEIHELPPLKDSQEILGSGVSGKWGCDTYSLTASPENASAEILSVDFKKNDILISQIFFKDDLRDDSPAILRALQEYQIKILSGDKQSVVQKVATLCGLSPTKAHGELSPEQKLEFIKQAKNTCMIGDGANDALALQAAEVGIAVKGSSDLSLSSADVYFIRGGLSPLLDLIALAKGTRKVIYRNLSISLIYNSVGGVLALSGYINPLAAAILMPISSALIVLSSLKGAAK